VNQDDSLDSTLFAGFCNFAPINARKAVAGLKFMLPKLLKLENSQTFELSLPFLLVLFKGGDITVQNYVSDSPTELTASVLFEATSQPSPDISTALLYCRLPSPLHE
jgi:hypothetical protein